MKYYHRPHFFRPALHASVKDPENAIQERCNALGAILFFLVAVWSVLAGAIASAWRWAHYRKDCCYCTPHHRMAGNPFVREKNRSHGICPKRLAEETAPFSHGAADKPSLPAEQPTSVPRSVGSTSRSKVRIEYQQHLIHH